MAACRRFLRLASLSDSRCGSLSHVSLQPACLARRIIGDVSAKWFGYFYIGYGRERINHQATIVAVTSNPK